MTRRHGAPDDVAETRNGHSDPAFASRRALYASIAVAVILIVTKLAAYLVTGTVSILSSLIDSSVDLIASLVTLYALVHAQRPADAAHRYGHGKAEALAALAQSAFIVGSALFLSVEAVARLIAPTPLQDTGIGIGLMVFSIAVTTALVLYQRHVQRRTGSLAVAADSLHYRSDLLINLAVIAAMVLVTQTGVQWIDPALAIVIVAILVASAIGIARRSLDMLMDRELPSTIRAKVESIVLDHPATRGLHDLRTRASGERVFIELHLELDPHLTLTDAHAITDTIETSIRRAFPNAECLIHQEPEGLEDDRLDHRI